MLVWSGLGRFKTHSWKTVFGGFMVKIEAVRQTRDRNALKSHAKLKI